jgi:hypothetical protein
VRPLRLLDGRRHVRRSCRAVLAAATRLLLLLPLLELLPLLKLLPLH